MSSPVNPTIYLDDFARANFSGVMATSDFTPIVAAALASFDHLADNVNYAGGGTIVFGPGPGNAPLTGGVYNFLTQALPNVPQGFGIELNRTVRLVGTGPGQGAVRAQLVFAVGLGGVRANTIGHPLNSSGATSGLLGAYGWELRDLQLVGNAGGRIAQSPAAAHGVYADINGKMINCSLTGFSGNGIMLHGQPDGTGADFDYLECCDVTQMNGCGIWIEGHDANCPLLINCQAHKLYTPGTYGFYFNTLTGVTMIGGQLEACHNDVWANNPSATDCFIGVYKESGEPVTICGNATVFGGGLANDLLTNPSINTPDAVGGQPTVIGGAGMATWLRVKAPSGTGYAQLGSPNASSDALLTLTDMRESGGAWPFSLKSYVSGGLYFDWASTGYPVFGFVNSRCTKANGFPIDAASIPEFSNGGVDIGPHLTGDRSHKIFVGVASVKPTSTAYPVGSIMHNNAAVNVGDPTLWKLVNRTPNQGGLQWVVGGAIQS